VNKSWLILYFSLITLPCQPWLLQAWAVDPCPGGFVPQLEQSLHHVLSNAKVVETLRLEKSQAMAEYNHVMEGLSQVHSSFAAELQARAAYQAQVKYCDAHNRLVKLGEEKYELMPMNEEFIGEHLGKSGEHLNRWAMRFPEMADKLIPYLSPQEKETIRVHAKNGKLLFASGAPLHNVREADYVMDQHGSIFILDQHGDPRFKLQNREDRGYRHSSVLRGEPGAAFGTISFDKDGNITEITRRTGHYQRLKKYQGQFVGRLHELGVDLSHAKIEGD
jgi:hypothetical protein